MVYRYNLPNSTEGIDTIVSQTISVSPFLPALLLFFVFMVIFLGGSARQKTRTGTADFSAWAVVGSVSTLMLALLMSVSEGFISLDWLVIVVTLNILSAFWFFLDRKSSEV